MLEFLAFAGVLCIVTIIMLYLYLPAATKVKTLRASSAGALVGLSAETLEGLKVVQAFSHQPHFVEVRCHTGLSVAPLCRPAIFCIARRF